MGFFRVIGLKRASALAGKAARRIGPKIPLTKRARTNLHMCFPEKDSTEVETIIADMWENLGRTFAEYAHFRRYHAYRPDGHLVVEGSDIIDRLEAAGKGAIYFSGHFANWELFPLVMQGKDIPLAGVYRAPNNPYIDQWILKQRTGKYGTVMLPKGAKGAKQMIQLLKQKHTMGLLVDQKLNDGMAVPFFGRDAMTAPAAAQMSLKFDCPLVPYTTERVNGHHFKIVIHEPLEIAPTGKKSEDTYALLVKMNASLENHIRAHPSQWLWLHNRWPKN